MDGEIDDFIDAYLKWNREKRIQADIESQSAL
jgi:hypothetical protein